MSNIHSHVWALALLSAVIVGCGSDSSEGGSPSKDGSTNVTQGGAQDFAQFRSVVDEGGVPAPELLDPVGFFAEHAVDLPPASCGADVCIHPMLGVMRRFDHRNWTMGFIAMNTPVDPSSLERPPLHLVVAIEDGTWLNGNEFSLTAGLQALLGSLRADDHVSFVSFGHAARVLVEAKTPASVVIDDLQSSFEREGTASLYDGLATAARLVGTRHLRPHASRVLLLTSGRADAGITDPERIVRLAESIAKKGVALGVVGVGSDYDARLPSAIGSLGAGSYSYAPDGAELEQVLQLEAETTLFPLVTDFRMTVLPAPGYRIGRIYGVQRAKALPDKVTLEMPALFIGQRDGAKDVGGGRRGGGGGLFVELIADSSAGVAAGAPAFQVQASWTDVKGKAGSATEVVNNALAPGENPADMWPSFSDSERGKAFMMLNMYLALRASVVFFAGGDCHRAAGVSDMMRISIEGWQGKYADPDLSNDDQVLLQLRQNIMNQCKGPVSPIPPEDADMGCGML